MKPARRILVALLIVAALSPPLATFLLIRYNAVNVPFWDDWPFVPFILKLHTGSLTFGDVWEQHNEHRIAVVRVLMAIIERFSRYNVVTHMYVGFALNCLSFAAIAAAIHRTLRPTRPWLTLILVLVSSLLMFSAVQSESWVWAMASLCWYSSGLCAAGVVLVWALWPTGWRPIVGTLLLTGVSMLTLLGGVSLVLVCLGGILLHSFAARRRPAWRHLLGWLCGTVALLGIVFAGYEREARAPGAAFYLAHFQDLVAFALIYLGRPLVPSGHPAWAISSAVAGLLLSGGACWWLGRSARPLLARLVPWLLLINYALLTDCATAAGRVMFGALQAESPRYTSIGALFWIGVAVVCAVSVLEYGSTAPRFQRAAVPLLLAVLFAFAPGYWGAYHQGVLTLNQSRADLMSGLVELYSYETAPDDALEVLYPVPSVPRDFARKLEAAGLGPFAPAMAATRRKAATIEAVPVSSGTGVLEGVSPYQIGGWAWSQDLPSTPIKLDILDGETPLATIAARRSRADLVNAKIGDGNHGFVYTLPAWLQDGRAHRFRVRISGTGIDLAGSPATITMPDSGIASSPVSGVRSDGSPVSGRSNATRPPPNYDGFVELVNCDGVEGWIVDANALNRRVKVEIYLDDHLLKTVPAEIFRKDLEGGKLGDGKHLFSVPLPATFKDGRTHSVEVRAAGSEYRLPHLAKVPKSIQCGTAGPLSSAASPPPAPSDSLRSPDSPSSVSAVSTQPADESANPPPATPPPSTPRPSTTSLPSTPEADIPKTSPAPNSVKFRQSAAGPAALPERQTPPPAR